MRTSCAFRASFPLALVAQSAPSRGNESTLRDQHERRATPARDHRARRATPTHQETS